MKLEALAKLLGNPSTSSGRTGCIVILLEISVRGELVEPQRGISARASLVQNDDSAKKVEPPSPVPHSAVNRISPLYAKQSVF
jgi:hypothetical protein